MDERHPNVSQGRLAEILANTAVALAALVTIVHILI